MKQYTLLEYGFKMQDEDNNQFESFKNHTIIIDNKNKIIYTTGFNGFEDWKQNEKVIDFIDNKYYQPDKTPYKFKQYKITNNDLSTQQIIELIIKNIAIHDKKESRFDWDDYEYKYEYIKNCKMSYSLKNKIENNSLEELFDKQIELKLKDTKRLNPNYKQDSEFVFLEYQTEANTFTKQFLVDTKEKSIITKGYEKIDKTDFHTYPDSRIEVSKEEQDFDVIKLDNDYFKYLQRIQYACDSNLDGLKKNIEHYLEGFLVDTEYEWQDWVLTQYKDDFKNQKEAQEFLVEQNLELQKKQKPKENVFSK